MDTSKLYEVCDIKRRTTAVTDGEESFVETAVYSSVPCYVKTSKAQTNDTTLEQSNTQTVFITIDKGYVIEIGDLVIVGNVKYKTEEVKAFGLIQNANVRLKCTKI